MHHTRYSKRHMQPLTNDIQLHSAKMNKTPIVIFFGPELVGSGVIEDITETHITIKGEHYIRGACMFRYAG
ncbi:hypothetical protein [Paenibacillus sp. Marseille-Q4541]|uniref:hypothetical protein n=1 Tax=Paenibacillus sp. Marseille-Q4541 TaxID=2831522 RepID=UPI001BA8D4AC|nr:hypothetical protein [Paenibacillus sp. Marseille-Q4541]